jgi:hypothetical protein
MNAKKLAKKFAAVSMAAAMVFTAPAVAFADNPGSSAISQGTSNSHVDRHKTLVTLPTVGEHDFDFIVDPERLIDATSGGTAGIDKDGNTVTPNAAGVYFTNNVNSANSASFNIVNIGTEDITATVKLSKETITPQSGYTEMALSDGAANWTKTDGAAVLQMELKAEAKIDDASPIHASGVITDTAVELSLPISGSAANYEITSNGGAGYKFQIKSDVSSVTDPAAGWDHAEFYLDGNCQEGSAKGLEAPKFKVTWEFEGPDNEDDSSKVYEAPAEEPTPISLTTTYDSSDRMYKVQLPAAVTGLSDITNFKVDGYAISSENCNLNSTKTILRTTKDGLKASMGGVTSLPETFTFTLTIDGVNYSSSVSRD